MVFLPTGSRLVQEEQPPHSGSVPVSISDCHLTCCYRLIPFMHVNCAHVLLQKVPVFSFAAGIVRHGKVFWVGLLRVAPGYQDSTCWTGWILSGKCSVLANQGSHLFVRAGKGLDLV